jgi:uncharacterized repeat protein (TIGR01451 family)
MRTFIKNMTEKLSTRTSFVAITLVVAAIVPAVAFAWGPNRPTFTEANPADYVTFNSITDNRKWGDERNFMRIREAGTEGAFTDVATLQPGKQYDVVILYHNNAKTSLNASGVGVAQNAYARTEIPALVRKGQSNVKAMSYVGASNANPAYVYDHIDFTNNTTGDIALRYVKGSAKLTSNGAVNGAAISENLFTSTGTPIGYDALNGTLPGCDEFSGYIMYRLIADSPDFTFTKDVRLAGTKDWKDDVTVNKGDKVEYRLRYQNTGTVEQRDVVMKDVLPKGLTYVSGETDMINGNYPNGKRIDDSINGDGVNVGHYAPNGAGYIFLFAKADGDPCTVLTNTASVETRNGNLRDTATVRINGNCEKPVEALPTTGPIEVISGLMGIAAITIGVIYYMKSRRELEDALRSAQTHPTMTKVDDLTPAEPEHKK